MSPRFYAVAGWAAGLAMAAGALANALAQGGRSADPADAQVAVPPVAYRSALTAPRTAAEPSAQTWHRANDNVARIGGWRTYLREAQRPDPPASTPAGGQAPKESAR
jgi:hypothetical protein